MKRAEVRTELADAERVAAAIRPDNTAELTTRVEGSTVVTAIERETTSGLRSTLDDYLVNLQVARDTNERTAHPTDDTTTTDSP